MDTGRSADLAVGWYCHMRMKKLIAEGVKQNAIAEQTGLQPSAVNGIVKSAKGVGPTTAAALVALFGFGSRGQLVDAADAWFQREGAHYVARESRAMAREQTERARQKSRGAKTAKTG